MFAPLALLLAIGPPGESVTYRRADLTAARASDPVAIEVALGAVEGARQWLRLTGTKSSGGRFSVWLLDSAYPPRSPARYIVAEGHIEARPPAREFRDALTGAAVLPTHGGWAHLLPTGAFGAERVRYLGHEFIQTSRATAAPATPPEARIVALRPDLLTGPASNTRQTDERRRYDGSDYTLVELTEADYREMHSAGVTCVRVNAKQAPWADALGLYHWGPRVDLPYPEMLYRSNYLGPALYLDEPAVHARDSVLRPRLAKDPAFRRSITPQAGFDAFRDVFAKTLSDGAPWALMRELRARPDVNLGDMNFAQANLYTWETMPETALWQLGQDKTAPAAFVFEPPGRIGSRRTIPELDMTYGVQLPPSDPTSLTDIIYGFLRGAARATDKQWGVSIYGAVDRADAPFWLTHAYDLGATRFFFWDNYQLACVPFGEMLAHVRHLRAHAAGRPRRDLNRLRRAAEAAVLLPAGYGLGHVRTGKGTLWGVDELNLERRNRRGVTYRAVMSAFFTEVERLHREGVAFDLMWDLPNHPPRDYREVIRINEDGRIDPAHRPRRTPTLAPRITLDLTARPDGKATVVTATARVTATHAPVYYTLGTDTEGIYHNALAAFEVFGPNDEDYVFVTPAGLKPRVEGDRAIAEFRLEQPGLYRVRAATVDTAGRSAVAWRELRIPAAR